MANDLSIPDKYAGKNIWSYSKLSSFWDCKKAYYLQRIAKVDSCSNIWSTLGTTAHDVIEKLMKEEINITKAKEMVIKELDNADVLGITFPTQSMRDNYIKSIIHYLDNFKKPDMDKFKIELKQFLEIDDKNVLIGFIDFIILHNDGSIEIRDFKTSSKFSKVELKDKAKQLIVYSEMIKNNYRNINDVKVSFDMLKYCIVYHKDKKRGKMCERHKLVALNKDKIENDLLEAGYDSLIVQEMVIDAISSNTFPDTIKDNYRIEPYILEYIYEKEEIDLLYSWICDTISTVNNTTDFPAKILTDSKSEFWCSNLCGVNKFCEEYNEFIKNKENDSLSVEDDDLF